MDIAVDFGFTAQFNPAGGVDVALHLAVNENIVHLDLGLDHGLFADGQRAAFGFDRAFEAAMKLQFAGESQRPPLNSTVSGQHPPVLRVLAGCPERGESAGRGGRLLESRNVDIDDELFLGESDEQVKQA